jgi:hypothetical protein
LSNIPAFAPLPVPRAVIERERKTKAIRRFIQVIGSRFEPLEYQAVVFKLTTVIFDLAQNIL